MRISADKSKWKTSENQPPLPYGIYYGKMSGMTVSLNYDDKNYELSSHLGVKGINIEVLVIVEDEEIIVVTPNNTYER
jgi:hypothetical protein